MKKIFERFKLEPRDYVLGLLLVLGVYNAININIIKSYATYTHTNSMTIVNTLNDEVQLNHISRKAQGQLLRDVISLKYDIEAIKTKLRNENINN